MEEGVWGIIAVSVWLGAISAADIKYCRVPVWMLGAGGIEAAVILFCRFGSGAEYGEALWGTVPGILLLAIGLLTGKAGYGDGIVLLLLGMLLGSGKGMLLFGISLFLISVCSLILLTLRKAGKGSRIPYLPFLTVSWLLVVFG